MDSLSRRQQIFPKATIQKKATEFNQRLLLNHANIVESRVLVEHEHAPPSNPGARIRRTLSLHL